MSSNPFERGHAAHPGPVKPAFEEQAENSPKSPRRSSTKWPPSHSAHKKSVSLLGHALANRNQEQTLPPFSAEASYSSLQTPSIPLPVHSRDIQPQNVSKTVSEHSPTANMALVAPATPSYLKLASSTTPADLKLYDLRSSSAFFTSHRHYLDKAGGRGTSLERTPKEKRVQEVPNGHYSTNPGDTGISAPPPPISPPELSSISNNPPTEGVRAEYRSWREPRPVMAEKAWSIGKQGGNSSQDGQVEKSVKESLAGVEHNTRSRKASHSLGFFKEGLPEDRPKKRDSKQRGRSKENNSKSKDLAEHEDERESGQKSTPASQIGSPQNSKFSSGRRSTPESPREGIAQHRSGHADSLASPTEESYFDVRPRDTNAPSDGQIRALPPQLLADIRENHNLTPGAAKGSSFSSSLPVTESERPKPGDVEEPLQIPETVHEEAKIKDVAGSTPASSAEDEDDSGEEQISSALFVPHQSSHETKERLGGDLSGNGRLSLDENDRLDTANSQQWLEEHRVPSDEVDVKYIPQENQVRPLPSPALGILGGIPTEQDSAVRDVSGGSHDEGGYNTQSEESGFEDGETTPTASMRTGHMIPSSFIHDHQQKAKRPLEAIELIPYRHQVGGHTTMWRFSKRAVCKQLNNRENEFYERVERYHPQLLDFLPRYIGVLNVTFEKQIRRRSTRKDHRDVAADLVDHSQNGSAETRVNKDAPDSHSPTTKDAPPSSARIISQSLHSPSSASFPTVTFADNRHIIPSSFLQSHAQPQHISTGDNGTVLSQLEPKQSQAPLPDKDFTFRPSLSDKHAVSWGATTVNKTLRNEVFGEAFLQQPIPIHRHRKPASQNRSLPNRRGPTTLRASNSETSLKSSQQSASATPAQPAEESIRRRALKTAAAQRDGVRPLTPGQPSQMSEGESSSGNINEAEFVDKTGTSAPEPEITRSQDVPSGKRQRRYSSGGLRRKPTEVAEGRGNLKYFEEADDAGYKGDVEDVFSMDPESSGGSGIRESEVKNREQSSSAPANNPVVTTASSPGKNTTERFLPPARTGTLDYMGIYRPVNPKEAQTQTDSRVQFFLLLEDLTAGMKRPCIMDLKMGTRQYGVDANEKKQKSQRQKCAETTSKELGVRVCGLQVWDNKSQSYVFQDKYFGRELKAGREFQNALTRFLYDGVDYSSVLRHIPTILRKLSELEVLIRSLIGYRFYAASLLMFYDGEPTDETESDSATTEKDINTLKEIDFKIADFANCITKEGFSSSARSCPPRHPDSPDNGFLRGLKSLRKYFVAIQHDIRASAMGIVEGEHGGLGFDGADDADEGNVSY